MKENLLDLIAYHEKWHSKAQSGRTRYFYNTNDFLIEEIFRRLEITQGVFVEFGAWDGVLLSNTRRLFERGWGGILIESHPERYEMLKNNYMEYDYVITINQFLDTKDNLIDNIFEENLTRNIDFCSIDIDGLDLDIFETFKINLPKVVCIEGGQVLHPFHERVTTHISQDNIQQSLSVMNEVFESKGYKLLCAYQDAFFIKEEYYHLFDVEKNLMNHYIDGLLALPRIPYIKSLLYRNNLTNEVLDKALKGVPYYSLNLGDKASKMMWIDNNYTRIRQNLEELRQ